MNCHATRIVLDLHAEGRLTPRRAKSVVAHLASCAECRTFAAPAPSASPVNSGDFKSRLAAAMKAERKTPKAVLPEPRLDLWPRDLSGIAFAAAALLIVAIAIGWSGVPSQKDLSGEELAAGSIQ